MNISKLMSIGFISGTAMLGSTVASASLGPFLADGSYTFSYSDGADTINGALTVSGGSGIAVSGSGSASGTDFAGGDSLTLITTGFGASAGCGVVPDPVQCGPFNIGSGGYYKDNTVYTNGVDYNGLIFSISGPDATSASAALDLSAMGPDGNQNFGICFSLDGSSALGAGCNNSSTGTFELTAVPVPGAVWLFGSALGLLGVTRRKSLV